MKLLQRILLPITLIIMLSMSVLSYLTYNETSKSLTESSLNTMQVTTQSMQRMLDYTIASSKSFVKITATGKYISNLMEKSDISPEELSAANAWLKTRASELPMINGFNLISTKGIIVASSNPSAVGTDLSFRDYFQTAIKGTIPQTAPRMSTITNEVLQAEVVPIKNDQGQIIGVLSGDISFAKVYDTVFKGITVGSKGFAFAIDSKGRVVLDATSNDTLLKDNLSITPDMRRIAAEGDGVNSYVNLAGYPVIAYSTKVKGSDIIIIARAEERDIFSDLTDLRNLSLMATLVAMLVSAFIAYIIVRPVVSAVAQGASFATAIANGNFSGTLKVQRSDEIGHLANALRSIPESLHKVTEEYSRVKEDLLHGNVLVQGNDTQFEGAFAELVQGTNTTLAQYQSILHNLTSPLVMLDKQLRVVYANEICQKVVGTDYLHKSCKEIMNRDDSGTPSDALNKAVATLRPATGYTIARPRGMARDIAYTAIPFTDSTGKLACVLQLITDLTEIKDTERTIVEVANNAQDISERMATASRELSAQVNEVSIGAETQRDRVTSTAAAMEQMNTAVLEVAHNAGEANSQSDNVRNKATEGTDLVHQVVTAIKSVNDVALELEKNMQQLGKQAESIGSVMDVISDIADQTNLLALNAAIEAARAGEAGRGFAVVADEVRKLAEKTMSATTEVGNSIRGIQQTTTMNIERVSQSTSFAAKATELAAVSGAALEEILDLANNNTALISGIATAAEEQSATSEEINNSIDEINHIASATATGMQEASQAVHELSEMASELQVLLQRLMQK